MKILVRLPNWLGDMVMASGLINALPHFFGDAEVSVIVKKGIHELASNLPGIKNIFVFDKEKYKGLGGAWSFGSSIKQKEKFDLFICLPNSFSSAVMAKATGAKKRVGYKKEGRNFLLTDAYQKEEGQHRVEEYFSLVENFTGKKIASKNVCLQHHFSKKDYVVVNINSEAESRRLTVEKAVDIIRYLSTIISLPIKLIGAPKEKEFVDKVYHNLPHHTNIQNIAGATTIPQLIETLASARIVLSTDSGPAHLANALGTQTVVLFGAGNEANTGPYNKEKRKI